MTGACAGATNWRALESWPVRAHRSASRMSVMPERLRLSRCAGHATEADSPRGEGRTPPRCRTIGAGRNFLKHERQAR
eukprot:15469264-Alexandrium_andersonii.AAC.1